ncbi:MAG: alpha/beta fold hydrolase [Raineya sp.]|jgi:predicted alpha/beta hydrolase|nr:alpha/beta fold hydrolase [Raineya sp.]
MQILSIPATDGYLLASTLFEAKEAEKGIVCINSAGGVSQKFYHKYATYLTENGFTALTWDVRGIAASRPKKLRGFQADFEDWAEKDFKGILKWLTDKYQQKIHIIGHSIGGAYAGMIQEHENIASLMTVATQGAYYKDWDSSIRRKLYFQWHVLMPIITKIWGYFPGKKLGLLEDIPAGVIKDWHDRKKYPNLIDQHKAKGKQWGYHLLKLPMKVIGITDDPIGTPQGIERFTKLFENPQMQVQMISPEQVQTDKIGHFDFFRSRFKETLWSMTLEWLNSIKKQ